MNPHALRHENLNLACLPVSPRPRAEGGPSSRRIRPPKNRRLYISGVSAAAALSGVSAEALAGARRHPVPLGTDPLGVRDDFPVVRESVYLDSAYITPSPRQAVEAASSFAEMKAIRFPPEPLGAWAVTLAAAQAAKTALWFPAPGVRIATQPETRRLWRAAPPFEALAEALAAALGVDRNRPLVVAGSTAPDEHALLRDATPPGTQLLCAPRKPEWFDEAARDLAGCARRSGGVAGSATNRFLLDTIGELRLAYALADVVQAHRDLEGRATTGSTVLMP